jgi:hypothetical protein
MQQIMIQLLNCALVVIILIGIPAICSIHIGKLQLSSSPLWKDLTLWGLALAAGLNLLGAALLATKPKAKTLFFKWTLFHSLLFAVEFLFFAGYIHFNWLKNFLLWAKKQFGS